jgi:hypothetical protein
LGLKHLELIVVIHFMHIVLMLFFGITVALLAGPAPVIGAITSSLQNILGNTHGSKDYGYPTDLTRDILPVSFVVLQWFSYGISFSWTGLTLDSRL